MKFVSKLIIFLFNFALQTKDGKRIIHRDLATRNILIHKDEKSGAVIYKIGDFGLARAIADNEIYSKDTVKICLKTLTDWVSTLYF